MRWFRSNIRSGAWCALVALALQFALTFTHVHVPKLGAPAALAALTAAVDQAAADQTAALPDEQPAKPQKPHGAAGDFCAICSLIQLAASSVTASSPSLPIPIVTAPVRFTIGTERALAASQPHNFQARAPPIA
jgi:hypothetical protein